MDEQTTCRLLSDLVIPAMGMQGYTHDLAARVLERDGELAWRFHIVADERGFGPINWIVEYQSVLSVLEQLAQIGGEQLRFWPDGGIEFWPIPESERVGYGTLIRRAFPDADKG